MKHIHSHIFLLILAASTALFTFSLYGFMHYRLSMITDHALATRDLLNVEKYNENNQDGITQSYNATAAARARLRGLFVPADNVVVFIEALEGIGRQADSKVELSTITADSMDSAPVGTVGSVHVHVDAKGSWSAVVKTLMLAERLPYQVTIDRLVMDTGVASGHDISKGWRLSFDIRADLIVTSSKK